MNTNIYCYVENNEILQGPILLPSSWNNISNLNTIIDNTILKELGWLPYEIVKINPNDPILVSTALAIEADKVVETMIYRPQTPEEAQAELEAITEAKWQRVRRERDRLLKETDVWALVDIWEGYNEQAKENARTYRQALRDIPQTYNNPDDVVWPTVPQ